jgi:hypothetical protein
MRYEVIPAKSWKRDDGKRASIYGSVPWRDGIEAKRWTVVEDGWTVQNPYNGEVGVGRPPWKTREEAEAWAAQAVPSRIGIGD